MRFSSPLMIVMCFSGVVHSIDKFLLVFWTETNGGFPGRDFYWRVAGSRSISLRLTAIITVHGSMSQRKTSILFNVTQI